MYIVAGLARPFPLAVICELLGLPEADQPMFVKTAQSLSNPSWFEMVRLLARVGRMIGYLRGQIGTASTSRRGGLIWALVNSEQDGQRLTAGEMEAMILLLLFAGHVTTVHRIGGGAYTVLSHPEQRQLLMADESLLNSAIHEMLRYLSPVQTTKPMLPIRNMT